MKVVLLSATGCVDSALRKEALHRGSVYHYRRVRRM